MNQSNAWALCGALALAFASAVRAQNSAPDPKAQVNDALFASGAMKAAIAESFAQFGKFPGTLAKAGLDRLPSTPVAALNLGAEGVITITFTAKAAPELRDKIMKIVPMASENSDVIFYCLAPALPAGIRPASCR